MKPTLTSSTILTSRVATVACTIPFQPRSSSKCEKNDVAMPYVKVTQHMR